MQIATPAFSATRKTAILPKQHPAHLQSPAQPTVQADSVQFGMLHRQTQQHQNTNTLIDVHRNMLTEMEKKNVNMDYFSDKVVKWGIRGLGHAAIFGMTWPAHIVATWLAPVTGGMANVATAIAHTGLHAAWEGVCWVAGKLTGKAVRKAANRISVLEVPDKLKSAKEKILKNVETLAMDIDKSKTPRAKNLAQGKFLRDSVKAIVEANPEGQTEQTKKQVAVIDKWIQVLEAAQDTKNFKDLDTQTKQHITELVTEMLKDSNQKVHEAGWEIGKSLGLSDAMMRDAKKAS